jgi:hypothetical protein
VVAYVRTVKTRSGAIACTDLDALSRPTLGFPADVMREASVVAGVYGAQLPDIDDPRAEAVRRTTSGT